MKNLFKETVDILERNGHTFEDILYFTNGKYNITPEKFKYIASNFDYDNGYGTNYVNFYLLGIGEDFFITREEYDGSEWWCYFDISAHPNADAAENIVLSADGIERYSYNNDPSDEEYEYIRDTWNKYNPF